MPSNSLRSNQDNALNKGISMHIKNTHEGLKVGTS